MILALNFTLFEQLNFLVVILDAWIFTAKIRGKLNAVFVCVAKCNYTIMSNAIDIIERA